MNTLIMRSEPKTSITDKLNGQEDSEPRKSSKAAPSIEMTAVIKGKDPHFKPWSETAQVTSLSSSGAGFFMAIECQVGQLVSLIMPMPPHIRKYDHDKRLYRVWGLVQYCYKAVGDGASGYHVGVALTGKDAPESYAKRPDQCYRVCGMDRNGLWKIEELERSFTKRSSVRYWNSLEVTLYQLDDEQHTIAAEKTVTENISETGSLVFSDLRLSVGDRVKVQCSSPPFSSLSIVRHRRIGVDDRTRLHLEFVENTFPILEIEAPIEEGGEH
jgi:PilZ domain-containing protein